MRFRAAPLTAATLLTLIAINVLLLRVAMQDHDPGEHGADLKTNWVPNLPGTPVELAASRPISAHSEILARPVFFKTRQPFVPPPPAPPAAPKMRSPAPPPVAVDPGLVLGGVMIDGDTKRAYVFNKSTSQGAWLEVGETIVGWKVHSIDSGVAKLQQAGRTLELHLYPSAR